MKYFVNTFHRVSSNESATACAVMDYAQSRWEHRLIDEDRLDELVQSLKDEERRLLDVRPRLKPVDIFIHKTSEHAADYRYVSVDRVSFILVKVRD